MLRDKLAAAMLVAILAVGYCHDAKADGLPKSGTGILPIGEVAKAAPSSWSVFYLGGHVGYGWADWDGTIETTAGCVGTCASAGYSDHTHTLAGNGRNGGGQIGYNWQSGSLVFGVEADISWTNLGATGSFATDQYNPSVWDKTFDLSLDYFGTARVRLGYATGWSIMPYITGGFAWGQTSGDLAVAYSNVNGYVGTSHASVKETHFGWTVGGGLEWKLSKNVSLKAEYLYVDLGGETYLFKGKVFNGAPFETDSFPADLTFHTARIGLNYRFGAE